MRSFRTHLALCGVAALALAPLAAHAQLDDRTVVSILQECRKIADTAARTACYDNIPLGQTVAAAPSSQPAAPAPAPAAPATASGFGANQLPPQPAPAKPAAPDRIAATLTAATMVTPGVYRLTLEDGAQWQFVDAVSSSYDPPRGGSEVEIAAAALGSYLMTYRGQRAVRIRRIR
jgi:hypothetical protein